MNRRLFIFAFVLIFSCKKNISGVEPIAGYDQSSFSSVFEAYWNGMNNNYVFWDIDTVNWDAMHARFMPKFAALNVQSQTDRDLSVAYFRTITQNLIDCHYRLSFSDPQLLDSSIDPSVLRRKNVAPAIPFSFFADSLVAHYLSFYYKGDTSYIVYNPTNGKMDTVGIAIVTGLINNNILYFHLNEFYLQSALNGSQPYWLGASWNWFVNHLHDPKATSKGIIIDMRSNPGGEIIDLNFITGQFLGQPLHFAYTREKSGNGRLDYTPWVDAIVTPPSGASAVTAPIVVLTDRHSVSMAEITTMALRSLPNTHVIGDTTWGANGPLDTFDQLYGGGQFSFASFGYVYTPSAEYKYRDGKSYEGKGFPPDVHVGANQDSLAAGIDVQLNAAIKYLNKP